MSKRRINPANGEVDLTCREQELVSSVRGALAECLQPRDLRLWSLCQTFNLQIFNFQRKTPALAAIYALNGQTRNVRKINATQCLNPAPAPDGTQGAQGRNPMALGVTNMSHARASWSSEGTPTRPDRTRVNGNAPWLPGTRPAEAGANDPAPGGTSDVAQAASLRHFRPRQPE